MNFRPGVDLFLCVDAVPDKEVHILLGSVDRECVGRGGQVGKTPARRLGDPGVVITVAVEYDALVLRKDPADQLLEVALKILGFLQLVWQTA